MYKNILIPILLDHPEKAEEAVAIAKGVLSSDGKLTLLHVVEEIPGYVASQLPKDVLQKTLSAAKEGMEKIAGGMKGEVSAKVVVGHSSRTILEFAEKAGSDLIVITSHKPGLEDYLIGSTASRVVRHANCAVHVLR